VTRESDGRLRQLRLGCIIFVIDVIEVDKSDLLLMELQDEWMEMEAIAHRLSREVNVVLTAYSLSNY